MRRLYTCINKGNCQVCNSYQAISVLSVAGKILATIILNQNYLPESHFGFRKESGTTDKIVAERLVQEKCHEQHLDLYTAFIDLRRLAPLNERAF